MARVVVRFDDLARGAGRLERVVFAADRLLRRELHDCPDATGAQTIPIISSKAVTASGRFFMSFPMAESQRVPCLYTSAPASTVLDTDPIRTPQAYPPLAQLLTGNTFVRSGGPGRRRPPRIHGEPIGVIQRPVEVRKPKR